MKNFSKLRVKPRLQKKLCGGVQKSKGYWFCHVHSEGHLDRSKDSFRFCKKKGCKKIVLYWVLKVLACGMNQRRLFLCPEGEQGFIVKV